MLPPSQGKRDESTSVDAAKAKAEAKVNPHAAGCVTDSTFLCFCETLRRFGFPDVSNLHQLLRGFGPWILKSVLCILMFFPGAV